MRTAPWRWHPQPPARPCLKTMSAHRVLITCPPMLGMLEAFVAPAQKLGLDSFRRSNSDAERIRTD